MTKMVKIAVQMVDQSACESLVQCQEFLALERHKKEQLKETRLQT